MTFSKAQLATDAIRPQMTALREKVSELAFEQARHKTNEHQPQIDAMAEQYRVLEARERDIWNSFLAESNQGR